MLKPSPRLEPSYYGAFRCVGSVCEDTCCRGWRVPVDKQTYEKYQSCSHPTLGPKLHALVTINPAPGSDASYAEIQLDQGVCPFFGEGLCEVQATLGEELLSNNCAAYPRMIASVDGVLERSLDLSCPEAARLALSDPQPMQFVEWHEEGGNARMGSVAVVDTTDPRHPERPFRHIPEVRSLIISLLQNRAYSIAQRVVMLGRVCDELERNGTDEGCSRLQAIAREPVTGFPWPSMPNTARFETVIELILARIGSDATGRRFLDCYQSFMAGLQWTMQSTMEELAERLDAAFAGPYADFCAQHGYMLEHYLVTYAFRSLFPFGSQALNRKLGQNQFEHSITRQYQLMVVDFAMIETLLAGLAAFYGTRFGVPEALVLIQSATKTFEHSLSYPGKALDLLSQKGMMNCESMSMFLRQ